MLYELAWDDAPRAAMPLPRSAPIRLHRQQTRGKEQAVALSQGELDRLVARAEQVLFALQPAGPIQRRDFCLRTHRVVVLATPSVSGRRSPRDVELVLDAVAFGVGLQLRTIGRLAIVALELPYADHYGDLM